jgi:tRNA(Ile)-lysidine synthase
LLNWSRQDILDYLSRIGQDFITDSTNLERDALRNRIRLDVMPLLREINPQAAGHIADTARIVAEALPYYRQGVDMSTDLSPTTLHERLLGLGFTPAQEQQMWQSQRSGATFESATHRATFSQGRLVVEEKLAPAPMPILTESLIEVPDPLAWVAHKSLPSDTCVIDARLVSRGLTTRQSKPGDRFRPFGMKGGSRLVSDFLAERGLSVFERQRQWLVCHGDDIVWVIGHRIDDRFRITAATKKILKLSIKH